jgi:hypothetical protein
MKKNLYLIIPILLLSSPAYSGELVFQFKNPSFSGVGTGSQFLTIENQEATKKKAVQDKIDAALKAAALEQKNSILNRFMNNLSSRIYSQLAQQLTQNLFAGGSTSGTFKLDDNTIEYSKVADNVTLKITDSVGNVTEISIPVGSFSF